MILVGLLIGGSAMAQPPPPGGGGGGGARYGAAGCGLGSILFGAKPGFMQVFAATTNGTGGQTFAITSGTSNCDSSAANEAGIARAFVEANREAFAKDVSRGSGETIQTLASLSGCKDNVAVGVSLQKNFKRIFPSAAASNTDISAAAVDSLKQDKGLACAKLI
ncbi:MAG: DUF3015 domain-containing protein [Myxococcota bacterium]|nr:DUF3015 domain-containing protein [Myxococcota bacterium]